MPYTIHWTTIGYNILGFLREIFTNTIEISAKATGERKKG
jgi:hypothetical protein